MNGWYQIAQSITSVNRRVEEFKGTVMQIEKALLIDYLRVSKVS